MNLIKKIIARFFSDEDYVKNVKEANKKNLTYLPKLYSKNDNLPRPIEKE